MSDKITLCKFTPGWGLPNISPFCMKLETYLRMTNIPYETKIINNPRKAPKGKLPFIIMNEEKIGDSNLIIEKLKKIYGDPLDKNLTVQQKAEATAIQAMLEDHLYWVIMWSRWIEPTGWNYAGEYFFRSIPWPLRNSIKKIQHSHVKADLHAHGMGRHSAEEIINFGKRDITALAHLLGNKIFLLGEECTSIDATAYAFIGSIWFCRWDSALKDHLEQYENLLNYYQRVVQRYYPELPQKPKPLPDMMAKAA